MFQTIARLTPFALLRRYLALREAQLAHRKALLRHAERTTADAMAAFYRAGREARDRELAGTAQ